MNTRERMAVPILGAETLHQAAQLLHYLDILRAERDAAQGAEVERRPRGLAVTDTVEVAVGFVIEAGNCNRGKVAGSRGGEPDGVLVL